jgi:hypothetical protein
VAQPGDDIRDPIANELIVIDDEDIRHRMSLFLADREFKRKTGISQPPTAPPEGRARLFLGPL